MTREERLAAAQRGIVATALRHGPEVLRLAPPEQLDEPWRTIGMAMLALHARGHEIEPAALHSEVQRAGKRMPGVELWYDGGHPSADAAAIALQLARATVTLGVEVGAAARRIDDGGNLAAVVADLRAVLDTVQIPGRDEDDPWWSLPDVLAMRADTPTWVIPDLLAERERVVIVGGEGKGKALSVNTPLATTTGWTTMGEVRVGDRVFGPDGRATTVVGASDVMCGRECFQVKFSDGSVIVADAEHLWEVDDYWSRASRRRQENRGSVRAAGKDQRHKVRGTVVRTTRELATTLTISTGGLIKRNYSIETAEPLAMPDGDLPVDPYVLGVWLGDGSSRTGQVTLGDRKHMHIRDRLAARGYVLRKSGNAPLLYIVEGISPTLRTLGVLGAKHIPAIFLRGSVAQRIELLRGIMDTDGTVNIGKTTSYEITLCNETLSRDVHELLLGLGIKATIHESDAMLNGRAVGRRWRMQFQTTLNVVTLPWHISRIQPRKTSRGNRRFIVAVEPTESVPVRCIQVDNPRHLYLAGRELIATHNSLLCYQLALGAAYGVDPLDCSRRFDPVRVMVLDVENDHASQVSSMLSRLVAAYQRMAPDVAADLALLKRREIDLLKPGNRQSLVDAVQRFQPSLLVMGAGYKLVDSTRWDEVFLGITRSADACRAVSDTAVLIETHAGHGKDGDRNGWRPDGASSWLRWPEFGLGLAHVECPGRVLEVHKWRGDRVTGRNWPSGFRGGGVLPWSPLTADELDYERGAT